MLHWKKNNKRPAGVLSIKTEVFKLEWKIEGIKCVKLSVNCKDSSTHWAFLRPTCTLWGSPVILRGLSAPVGMGSSWIIIICTPVLSWRGTIRQEQKHTELPGVQKTIHSERKKFSHFSKNRVDLFFLCNLCNLYQQVNTNGESYIFQVIWNIYLINVSWQLGNAIWAY